MSKGKKDIKSSNSIKTSKKRVSDKKNSKQIVKKKFNKKKFVVFGILLVSLITLSISLYNIIDWKEDSDDIEEQVNEIIEEVEITEVPMVEENSNVEVITPEVSVPKENPYWDYVNMSLISVDFTDLVKKNSDTKGWIQVGGTNINYPFVQTTNNSFYLNHAFNKSYNEAGWVFMDYRNDSVNFSKNTILYAHSRLDKTMFGSLRNVLKSGWLNNSSNYVVKLSTPTENTLWQVFSVYHIPTTNDYIQVYFESDEEFSNWANMLISRSAHNFNTTVSENDYVLTLSTCYNETDKVVMHAKLIKKEVR